MEKKTDLRIIKTKKVIYEALIDLMKEKTFEEIKVSDICNKALINRSTFYAHYEDKYELLVEFINDLKSNFTNELDKRKHITDTREYYMELIKLFIDHVEEYRDIYSSIMTNNRNSIMMDILLSVINEDISKKIKNDKRNSSIPKVIIAKFYLGGLLSLGIVLSIKTGFNKELDSLNKSSFFNYPLVISKNNYVDDFSNKVENKNGVNVKKGSFVTNEIDDKLISLVNNIDKKY